MIKILSFVAALATAAFLVMWCFPEEPSPEIHDNGIERYYLDEGVFYLMDRRRELCFFVIERSKDGVESVTSAQLSTRSCFNLLVNTAAEAWSE